MGYPTRDNVCKLVEQCSQWEEKSAEYSYREGDFIGKSFRIS